MNNVSLSIYRNEKIGLTGPNGTGKSTLFAIILGEIEPNSGEVQRQKNLNIGFLPQEAHFDSGRTVMEELTSGDSRIASLQKEKRQLEEANQADGMRYGEILEQLEHLGIYELEHKAAKILSGLGFRGDDFHRPILNLSGGWQMRTLLAKLLTYSYDLLLLDEPTNYLDLEATLWLKDFLAKYEGTFLVISHDKVFLNEITNYTIVLEDGQMIKLKGNYATYEEQKGIRYKTLEKKQKVLEKRREQLEQFAQRFHAQPNRAAAVRNKRKMLERMETIELPCDRISIKDFEFSNTRESGYGVIALEDISKFYGEKKIYEHLNLELTRGQKVCLVGPNGAGKSTLLKMLAGIIEPDMGRRKLGHGVDLGYFSQTRLDVLNPNRSAFEEVVSAVQSGVPELRVRTLLGLFNFHGDDVFKPVKVLSGGEKSRLILAKLLINPPNFILLDEPTTHLDIHGVEALTNAFKAFEGTVCFISHDLFFVNQIANCIIEVEGGSLKTYPGGLPYYLEKKKLNELGPKGEKKKEHGFISHGKKPSSSGETERLRELKKKHDEAVARLAQIKMEIVQLEKEKKELEMESYVKARIMSTSENLRDQQILKEYGGRLKEIPKRMRAIAKMIDDLTAERNEISKQI